MIVLPFPPAILSPNTRCHWAIKARAAKQARKEAWALTKESGERITWDGPIDLHISFYPPSKRHYDWDNLIARMKPFLDGVADGLGVNDRRFRPKIEVCGVIKGGEVRIIISE